jgi:ferric-dicitrate binding protein FerR (iron transport regulator)
MSHDKTDDPRRRWLIKALAAGLVATTLPDRMAMAADSTPARPGRLPAGRSIFRLAGDVRVNGTPATLQTSISSTDTLETGPRSELIFVVGDNAMILRESSRLEMSAVTGESILGALRLLAGKLLSVTRNRRLQVNTTTATIGIRGTGFYIESEPQQTYFCTCYGTTDVAASSDPTSRDTIVARQHDKPVYIVGGAPQGQAIRRAPFINHTDQELMLIESIVGRTPPFVFPGSAYSGPRRDY